MRKAILRLGPLMLAPWLLVACVATERDTGTESAANREARASPAAGSQARSDEPAIMRIRAHYAEIERQRPTYACRKLDLEGFSAEGGELEACFAGPALRKLTARYYGESGRATEEFYFWDDSLEFLFARSERYDEPLSGRVVQVEENRYYWEGERLIRWLGPDQRPRPLNGSTAAEAALEGRESARLLARCAADRALRSCAA
jgi:hypothetical protein